jgi:hypothetical protein
MNEEVLKSLIEDEMIKNDISWGKARDIVFKKNDMPIIRTY